MRSSSNSEAYRHDKLQLKHPRSALVVDTLGPQLPSSNRQLVEAQSEGFCVDSVEDGMFPISVSVPTRFPALVTYALIAVNVVVFLLQLGLSERAGEVAAFTYGLVPARYSHSEWALRVGLNPNDYVPFLTNTFMHGGWLHLILNMWTLWLFGPSYSGHWPELALHGSVANDPKRTRSNFQTTVPNNFPIPAVRAIGLMRLHRLRI